MNVWREYENWRDSFYCGGANWEREEERQNRYKANSEKLQMAFEKGYLVTEYGEGCCHECSGCEHLHEVGMRSAEDDIELMYCSNTKCPHALKYRAEQED